MKVRTDGNENLMHHKVIIVDQQMVVFGSYNLSANANLRNAENSLFAFDEIIIDAFLQEFDSLWQESQIINPRYTECDN